MDLSKLSDEGLLKLYVALQRMQPAQPPPQQTAGQMAAEGTGALQGLAIGAGKGIDDVIQGVKQLYYGATGNEQELAALKAQQEEANRHYAPLKDSNPFGTSIGEGFPAMAGMALTGGAGGLPMALGKAALSSGLGEAAKYGDADERLRRGAVGALEGAAGTGVGYGVGKLISPVAKTVNVPSPTTMQAVQNLGVQLTPGQATGSIPLRKMEQMLAQRSGSAPVFAELADQNAKAVNRAAASALGETTDAIDAGVFAAARQRIGSDFERLTKGVDVKLGQDFLDALVKVEQEAALTLPALRSPMVTKVIDNALDLAASGKVSGVAYQKTRSRLSTLADEAFKGNNSDLARALEGIATALDDAAGASITKTEQAAWKLAQKQWSALRTLEKGNIVQDANVSQQLLKNEMIRKYGSAYKEGKLDGPLVDIARYAEGVKQLPDSGTAGLMAANNAGIWSSLIGSPLRYTAAQALLSKPGQKWLGSGRLDDEAMKRIMQGGGLLGVGGIGQ